MTMVATRSLPTDLGNWVDMTWLKGLNAVCSSLRVLLSVLDGRRDGEVTINAEI